MAVKIVTNSSSDIPKYLLEELDISVVPEYVIIDNKSYRDRIDISEDEFYHKLVAENAHSTTSCPTPSDFVQVYNRLGETADGIVSIHMSPKLSATYNSAKQAKELSTAKCSIEVIDSEMISLALGMVVIAAARLAKEGKSFQEIINAVKSIIPRISVLIAFDTLKYLVRGGRVGKAKSLVSSLLNVKPLLTLKEGEFAPVGQVRSYAKATEKLVKFANSFPEVEEMYAVYSTDRDSALQLLKRITSYPQDRIVLTQLGPVIGSHTGPGLLGIGVLPRNK